MGFQKQVALAHSNWNAFNNKDPAVNKNFKSAEANSNYTAAASYTYRPDRYRYVGSSAKTIVSSVFSRIAVDVASTKFQHVYVDENGQFLDMVPSKLNYCLTQEANIDQTGRDLIIDLVESLLDEGVVAVVPVDTDLDPDVTGSYDILSMRVGKILQWRPSEIQVSVYNERDGLNHELWMPKKYTAIIQNPFYSIMNEPNSTLKRLNTKLAILDDMDVNNNSSKLNLILQMPYSIKTPAMHKKADSRIKSLESQLTRSKFGLGYIDATEHITQLNRSIDAYFVEEIKDLTKQLLDQLGYTDTLLNGTADGQTMKNYLVRLVDPICDSITLEFKRKFLTKTARTQGQSIEYFREPFTFMPTNEIAEVADKFMRNQILTSNEFRSAIGFKPNLTDPRADQLSNPNIADVNQIPGGVDGGLVDVGSDENMDVSEEVSQEDDLIENKKISELD